MSKIPTASTLVALVLHDLNVGDGGGGNSNQTYSRRIDSTDGGLISAT